MNQGNIVLADKRPPGEGGPVGEGVGLGRAAQLFDPWPGCRWSHHRQKIQGPGRARKYLAADAGAGRQPPGAAAIDGHEAKFPVYRAAGPVELRVPGQDVGEGEPGPHHIPVRSPLGLEHLGRPLDQTPGLMRGSIGPIAIRGQSLEILQDYKGGFTLPPAPAHRLALVPDGPDLIPGPSAGHGPDDDPGQTLAPGGMSLDVAQGSCRGNAGGAEGSVPGGQDSGSRRQASEKALVDDGQAPILHYPGNCTVGSLGRRHGIGARGRLCHDIGLPRSGRGHMHCAKIQTRTGGAGPELPCLHVVRRQPRQGRSRQPGFRSGGSWAFANMGLLSYILVWG